MDNLAEALYVDGLPDDPKAKIAALESMVATQVKLDNVIKNAKEKITVPDKVAITRMASEEAKTSSSGRAKAMQEALAAAKLAEEGKSNAAQENEEIIKVSLGLGALRGFADKSSGKTIAKKTKDKKASESTDLYKMGKHLLK